MHLLTLTTTGRLIQAFSWMLIHSLWQGLLLAMLTVLVLAMARKASAAVRYNLVLIQVVLFILCCSTTFVWVLNSSRSAVAIQPFAGGLVSGATQLFNLNAASVGAFVATCINYFSANAPMVMLLWFVLFLFRSVKMMQSLSFMQKARYSRVTEPDDRWQQKVAALCQTLQLKRAVQLLESGFVKVPLVIGHLKPVIIMPIGLLTGLPQGQVEAVLLHELAHIRRNDYVVNFLQVIVEMVFFFNPGLLWISSLLRDERENCCDDIALAQTQNKREFIEALISFKEYALYGAGYQVAFPGKKNQLLQRVSRILQGQNKTIGTSERSFFLAGLIILFSIVATAAVTGLGTRTVANTKINTVDYAAITERIADTQINGNNRVIYWVERPKVKAIPPVVKYVEPVMPSGVADMDIPQPPSAEWEAKLNADQEKEVAGRELMSSRREEVIQQQQQVIEAQIQALRDRQRAIADQIQARNDQQQALRDAHQAMIDQQQAIKDREQARKDLEELRNHQASLQL